MSDVECYLHHAATLTFSVLMCVGRDFVFLMQTFVVILVAARAQRPVVFNWPLLRHTLFVAGKHFVSGAECDFIFIMKVD